MNTNPNAIRILAFGDSNTWGRVPGDDNNKRLKVTERWTGVLQHLLGSGYEIVEEGLNGRTTNVESPEKPGKNAKLYLFSCLESHKPIDLIVLALGKNDLKAKYNRTAEIIGKGVEECLEVIKQEGKNIKNELPKIILMTPGIIEEKFRKRGDKEVVDFLGGKKKSQKLMEVYKDIAYKWKIEFMDLSDIVTVSNIDGVHLDTSEHEKIAKAVYAEVITFFPDKIIRTSLQMAHQDFTELG